MNDVVLQMLEKYHCVSEADYKNALQEIIQETALLGLWRSKFFEHAAFYGGTALRILYGLDRFSEDLDFSLLAPNAQFSWAPYLNALETELRSFGFSVLIEEKKKTQISPIQSAFLKANTLENMVLIDVPQSTYQRVHIKERISIKIEIDTEPPPLFSTTVKYLLQPIPFPIRVYSEPDLFAGKLHAVLCRSWKTRVKGRDWYDLVWYVTRGTKINLQHLEARMRQSGHYVDTRPLTRNILLEMLYAKIDTLNIDNARADVMFFLRDPEKISIWSQDFFRSIVERIETT